MPRICEFYGIVIYMYYRDHGPPHFHALYAEHQAVLTIRSRQVLAGHLPNRALALVRSWAAIHQEELDQNWARAQENRPLHSIEALP